MDKIKEKELNTAEEEAMKKKLYWKGEGGKRTRRECGNRTEEQEDGLDSEARGHQ